MRRRGFIRRTGIVLLAALAVLAALIVLLVRDARGPTHPGGPAAPPLVVYCAAGVKVPVEEAARAYTAEFGVEIQLQYGGSQTQLAGAEVSRQGDLYLPADDSYIRAARNKGLVEEALPLATMSPVVAVKKGNPLGLHSIDDLMKPGVRVAQANPDAAAIGKLTRSALQKAGVWEQLSRQTVVFTGTVNDVANDVKIGSADAGIVWDSLLPQYPDLEGFQPPAFQGVEARIAVGVLSFSRQPTAALKFARYLAARDRGLKAFERNGYKVVRGDAWSAAPELRLLAGAMLRPAVEQTILTFERREGCRVTRVYNGCGILVAQMKAGERPDAYFACDASFMTQVTDLFLDRSDVSTNRLVIVVPKANPHHIAGLRDLGQPGLRVGVGHEKQCAMGALTQKTLSQGGLREVVMPNVKVQSPTGDFLVNQLRTGSLDAVIAYVSNAVAARDQLDTIPIDVPCAVATQPVAVGRESNYKFLTARLVEALESRQSKERFESQGFRWVLGQPPDAAGRAGLTDSR